MGKKIEHIAELASSTILQKLNEIMSKKDITQTEVLKILLWVFKFVISVYYESKAKWD